MGRNSKSTADVTGNREYFSLEKGSIKKKWKNRIPVALIYPNIYSLGMSNLGFQLVYDLLNQDDSIVAERVFFPESNDKPLSVESGRPLSDFPFLLFSRESVAFASLDGKRSKPFKEIYRDAVNSYNSNI